MELCEPAVEAAAPLGEHEYLCQPSRKGAWHDGHADEPGNEGDLHHCRDVEPAGRSTHAKGEEPGHRVAVDRVACGLELSRDGAVRDPAHRCVSRVPFEAELGGGCLEIDAGATGFRDRGPHVLEVEHHL